MPIILWHRECYSNRRAKVMAWYMPWVQQEACQGGGCNEHNMTRRSFFELNNCIRLSLSSPGRKHILVYNYVNLLT